MAESYGTGTGDGAPRRHTHDARSAVSAALRGVRDHAWTEPEQVPGPTSPPGVSGGTAAERSEALGNTGLYSPAGIERAVQAGYDGDRTLGWILDGEPTSSDQRWAMHTGVEWRHSPLRKVRSCRRAPFEEGVDEVGLTFAGREDGGVDVGINGTKTCGSWHSCLPCGSRIAVHRARELEQVFKVWEKLGNSVAMATFTMRHHSGHELRDLIEAQRAAWESVTSDRPWNADLDEMGVARFPTIGSTGKTRMIKGVIRAFECTYGDEHGWHPHFHVFFLVEGVIGEGRAHDAVMPMWTRWLNGLEERGFTAVAQVDGESAGLDVKVLGSGVAGTYGRYPFKLALEAVGGVFKQGRGQDRKGRQIGHRHRTPAEIVEHIAVAQAEGVLDDAQGAADLRIWKEWCGTANDLRLRQCPIPMRQWFANKAAELGIEGPLLDKDLDDADIAAAEVEGSQVGGTLSSRQWASTVAYEFDTLRAAGRAGGMTGVVAWFDVRGIGFELSRSGEHRLAVERLAAERGLSPPARAPAGRSVAVVSTGG